MIDLLGTAGNNAILQSGFYKMITQSDRMRTAGTGRADGKIDSS